METKKIDLIINAINVEQLKNKNFAFNEDHLKKVNNKSGRIATGKAAEYKKQLSTCKFKLVVYFNISKHGIYYTQVEKDQNKNRQYIPSFDLYNDGGRAVINHEIAFNQLIDYCLQNANRMQSARIILNDYINEEEQTIFIFNPINIGLSRFININYKDHEQTGGRFVHSLDAAPFRIDKLRIYGIDN